MVLFADFGKKEHVFSPVSSVRVGIEWRNRSRTDRQLRRQFHTLTSGWTTLSETERQMLGIKDGSAPAAVGSKTEGAVQPQT
jgi:hypothetical protein